MERAHPQCQALRQVLGAGAASVKGADPPFLQALMFTVKYSECRDRGPIRS